MAKIEWTDKTWNPIVGCSKISEGCRNCYAARFAYRWEAATETYQGTVKKIAQGINWTGEIKVINRRMRQPIKWKKPCRIFVNSMSDLFHENVPDAWIDRIFHTMALCPWHTFQILTKRPERMREYLTNPVIQKLYPGLPLPNVWLGVSVENQQAADERIPLLLDTPAAVRFLSCEPLLGPVDIINKNYLYWHCACGWKGLASTLCPNQSGINTCPNCGGSGGLFYCGINIDWVIAGGESGPGARPMHPDWVRSLRDQCQSVSIPFFFKQWGEFKPICPYDYDIEEPDEWTDASFLWAENPEKMRMLSNRGYSHNWPHQETYQPSPVEKHWFVERVGKKAAGRELDGRTWDEYPEGVAWA